MWTLSLRAADIRSWLLLCTSNNLLLSGAFRSPQGHLTELNEKYWIYCEQWLYLKNNKGIDGVELRKWWIGGAVCFNADSQVVNSDYYEF